MPRNIITGLSILSPFVYNFPQMVTLSSCLEILVLCDGSGQIISSSFIGSRSRCWGIDRSVDVHWCWPLLILHELHSQRMSKGKTYLWHFMTILVEDECDSNCLPVVVWLDCFPLKRHFLLDKKCPLRLEGVLDIHPCSILDIRGILIGFTWEHTFDGCVEAISSLFSAAWQHKLVDPKWHTMPQTTWKILEWLHSGLRLPKLLSSCHSYSIFCSHWCRSLRHSMSVKFWETARVTHLYRYTIEYLYTYTNCGCLISRILWQSNSSSPSSSCSL